MLTSSFHSPVAGLTQAMPLGLVGLPCEQPPPPTSAYICVPMNATSATPICAPVAPCVDGNPCATVVRVPSLAIREMRAVLPPVYGPIGGTTCGQALPEEFVPPVPASAT